MAPSYLSNLLAYRMSSYSLRPYWTILEDSNLYLIDPSQFVPKDCGCRCRLQYVGVRLLTFKKKSFEDWSFLKSLLICEFILFIYCKAPRTIFGVSFCWFEAILATYCLGVGNHGSNNS